MKSIEKTKLLNTLNTKSTCLSIAFKDLIERKILPKNCFDLRMERQTLNVRIKESLFQDMSIYKKRIRMMRAREAQGSNQLI